MIYALAIALFVVATIVAVLTLVDSSLIAHQAAAELSRERALLRRGFVPQVAAEQVRSRPAQPRAASLMQASRARALPLRFAAPACGAA